MNPRGNDGNCCTSFGVQWKSVLTGTDIQKDKNGKMMQRMLSWITFRYKRNGGEMAVNMILSPKVRTVLYVVVMVLC